MAQVIVLTYFLTGLFLMIGWIYVSCILCASVEVMAVGGVLKGVGY